LDFFNLNLKKQELDLKLRDKKNYVGKLKCNKECLGRRHFCVTWMVSGSTMSSTVSSPRQMGAMASLSLDSILSSLDGVDAAATAFTFEAEIVADFEGKTSRKRRRSRWVLLI